MSDVGLTSQVTIQDEHCMTCDDCVTFWELWHEWTERTQVSKVDMRAFAKGTKVGMSVPQ